VFVSEVLDGLSERLDGLCERLADRLSPAEPGAQFGQLLSGDRERGGGFGHDPILHQPTRTAQLLP
jgi:hypothetical protein